MDRGKYKMGTIARMTGFTPALLRAWERRHDLLDPVRTEGGHRLYTERDLLVLRRVRHWLDRGRSIGEIASLGRDSLLHEIGDRAVPIDPSDEEREAGDGEETHPAVEDQIDRCKRLIVKAAIDLDSGTLREAIDHAFAILSPTRAIRDVIERASVEIGDEWASGRCSVAGEHLATSLFRQRITKMIETANGFRAPSAPVAVCACFPDELHEMGCMIIAYHLARYGMRVHYLGASLPLEDLELVLDRLVPNSVYLSVSRPALFHAHEPRFLELAERWSDRIRFYVGGRGVPERPIDRQEAVERGVSFFVPRDSVPGEVAQFLQNT